MAIQLIDLSIPLTDRAPEPDPPRIKYISHKKGALLLGLGTLLVKGKSFSQHLANFCGYLLGAKRVSAKDFPDEMGLALEEIKSDAHAGTHMDAPWHFGPFSEGQAALTIDRIPLEWCYADGVVLDLRDKKPGEEITARDLQQALAIINYQLKPLDIVLLMTGMDRYVGTREYLLLQPGMSQAATLWLLEQGIKVIGIDAFGFDRPWPNMLDDYLSSKNKAKLWPAHLAGRKKQYCHLEKLANLHLIPRPFGFKVACFPIKIERAGAGWVRAVAIVS